jgi:hypothetical protein
MFLNSVTDAQGDDEETKAARLHALQELLKQEQSSSGSVTDDPEGQQLNTSM